MDPSLRNSDLMYMGFYAPWYFRKCILSCCLRYSPEYFVLVSKAI